MEKIRERLSNIESYSIVEQCDLLLQLSEDIQITHANEGDANKIELVKELSDKIHALRYRQAYNKSTDSALRDTKLKKAWEDLNRLK